VQENNLQRMFQIQDMAGQRINGNSMGQLLLIQQKRTLKNGCGLNVMGVVKSNGCGPYYGRGQGSTGQYNVSLFSNYPIMMSQEILKC
jgi:hypothetical protein